MRNRKKADPLFRIFVLLCSLVLLAAVAAIGLYYYFFSIPEPEGLSLANWPNRFTENFSVWMENEDGELKIKDIGLERLDEYGLWIQVIDGSGQEVFSYHKPEHYPASYSVSELIAFETSGYENGNTVFVGSYEASGEVWNYLVGFPYAIGKYMLYYNGETVGRLSPIFRMAIFFILCVVAAAFLVYGFWLTRQMGKITKGIESISLRTYRPFKENGIFSSIYAALNKMDMEIQRSDQLRENTERARQEWIANITHDLKTPLTIISGNAELLDEDNLPPAQQACVQAILRGGRSAENYVTHLQAITTGLSPAASAQTVSCADLAQACAALGRDLTAPKGITFSWQTDPHPLPDRALSLDRTAFLRAAENLLSNGVRYTPAGQTLDCGLRLTAQRLFLWVQDSGPGFSPEALAKAGKLFYTEEPSRPQGGHLGMGLYSAAQTARAHGGGLCLENTSRGGRATLWISIS